MKLILSLFVFLTLSLLGYAFFIEPKWIKENRFSINIAKNSTSSQTLNILHISDIHFSKKSSIKYIRKSFENAVKNKPDLILITGDFITEHLIDKQNYIDALSILSSSAPVFAVGGNHDGGIWASNLGGYSTIDSVSNLLESSNIKLLQNGISALEVHGLQILIGGVGDTWAGYFQPNQILDSMNNHTANYKILLSHNPDTKEILKGMKWDLLLCGHTHGGQIRLPVIGTPFAPVRDKSIVKGLFEYNGRSIHISAGIGNFKGIRFNCRPEYSIISVILPST